MKTHFNEKHEVMIRCNKTEVEAFGSGRTFSQLEGEHIDKVENLLFYMKKIDQYGQTAYDGVVVSREFILDIAKQIKEIEETIYVAKYEKKELPF